MKRAAEGFVGVLEEFQQESTPITGFECAFLQNRSGATLSLCFRNPEESRP